MVRSGLGAAFVSGTLRFLKNGPPEEIWSRRKLRKWEKPGLGAAFVSGTLLFLKNCHPAVLFIG